MNTHEEAGWDWFDTPRAQAHDSTASRGKEDRPREEIAKAFARCFGAPGAQEVMAHLRAVTVERVLSPQVDDRVLRHLEGQRQLVAYIEALVRLGRGL